MKLKRGIRRALRRILAIVLVAGFLVLLVAAGQEQADRFYREELNVSINYDDGNYFISEDEVKNRINGWLERPVSSYTISELNLHEIEEILLENPYLQEVDVYIDANGRLNISVEQRKPILRVINKQGVSYYLHKNGGKMPVSNNFTPRVAVATGEILDNGKYAGPVESADIVELNKLARFIHRDPFMKGLVDQVIVKSDGTYELVPKIENHTIWWGDGSNLEEKKRKLQLFYKKGIKKAGWKSYKRVDLRFKDQIVCKKR